MRQQLSFLGCSQRGVSAGADEGPCLVVDVVVVVVVFVVAVVALAVAVAPDADVVVVDVVVVVVATIDAIVVATNIAAHVVVVAVADVVLATCLPTAPPNRQPLTPLVVDVVAIVVEADPGYLPPPLAYPMSHGR